MPKILLARQAIWLQRLCADKIIHALSTILLLELWLTSACLGEDLTWESQEKRSETIFFLSKFKLKGKISLRVGLLRQQTS